MLRIQQKYVTSAVDDYWKKLQRDLLAMVQAPLVLCVYRRNDSPGYSTQYCTYSLMDASSNQILPWPWRLLIVDMEKQGFIGAVDDVLSLRQTVPDTH